MTTQGFEITCPDSSAWRRAACYGSPINRTNLGRASVAHPRVLRFHALCPLLRLQATSYTPAWSLSLLLKQKRQKEGVVDGEKTEVHEEEQEKVRILAPGMSRAVVRKIKRQ